MTKVYCKDCKHIDTRDEWDGYYSTTHVCLLSIHEEDNWYSTKKRIKKCKYLNQNNNCTDYEKRVGVWETIINYFDLNKSIEE